MPRNQHTQTRDTGADAMSPRHQPTAAPVSPDGDAGTCPQLSWVHRRRPSAPSFGWRDRGITLSEIFNPMDDGDADGEGDGPSESGEDARSGFRRQQLHLQAGVWAVVPQNL